MPFLKTAACSSIFRFGMGDVVLVPIVSSTLRQQLWPHSKIHLHCVTVVPRPEVHACWGNGRSRAQGPIHTGVTAQEARKDLAERDQPNSQDSVDAEIEQHLPRHTSLSSSFLDCPSNFVRGSENTCGS